MPRAGCWSWSWKAPILTQFQSLLLDLLMKCKGQLSKPIVIVLDVADECDSGQEHQKVLTFARLYKLPSMVKMFVASQHDIKEALECMDSIDTIRDIR